MRILTLLLCLGFFAPFAEAMPYLGGSSSAPTSAASKKNAPATADDKTFNLEVGREFRYERGSNFNYVDRSPMSLHFSYKVAPIWWGRAEFATFADKSGNETLNYRRQHTDVIGWLDWKPDSNIPLKPFIGAGLGFFRETITTHFHSETSSSDSQLSLIYGVSGGLAVATQSFIFSGELRFFGGEVDPNPLASGVLRVGMRF